MMVQAYTPNTWAAKTRGSEVQHMAGICVKFEVSWVIWDSVPQQLNNIKSKQTTPRLPAKTSPSDTCRLSACTRQCCALCRHHTHLAALSLGWDRPRAHTQWHGCSTLRWGSGSWPLHSWDWMRWCLGKVCSMPTANEVTSIRTPSHTALHSCVW